MIPVMIHDVICETDEFRGHLIKLWNPTIHPAGTSLIKHTITDDYSNFTKKVIHSHFESVKLFTSIRILDIRVSK